MSEYLQLCEKVVGRPNFTGWLMSEKLDGMRAWWDGGRTRGMHKDGVPYANRVKGIGHKVCTGLWSRLGNVIPAPSWWLDSLPVGEYLDGELYAGLKYRQHLLSWIKSGWDLPEKVSPWKNITLRCYDIVPGPLMNSTRTVSAGKYKWTVRPGSLNANISPGTPYLDRYSLLDDILISNPVADRHNQKKIKDWEHIDKFMSEVTGYGGEGLVIRDPKAMYVMARSKTCLKYKDHSDCEVAIVGYNPGSGRNVGRLGSYRCTFGAHIINVSGMDDDERDQPLSIGTVITMRYRGLSADGVPQEARSMGPRKDI